jgi:hypothetical protein
MPIQNSSKPPSQDGFSEKGFVVQEKKHEKHEVANRVIAVMR